jgi:hypothetical protein
MGFAVIFEFIVPKSACLHLRRASLALTLSLGALLSACQTPPQPQMVYVPVVVEAPPPPSSLVPQPIMLFNMQKQGRKLFTLNDEYPYCDAQTGIVVVVPKWYVTDFASVPWYGQGVVNPQGPTARAAIIHDWLYAIGEPGKRLQADDIFYRAMRKFGVSEFEAGIAYNAVRTGGEGGYGLKGDWLFVDPARPSQTVNPPFLKPKTGVAKYVPGCRGFEQMVATGWKAWPTKYATIAYPGNAQAPAPIGPFPPTTTPTTVPSGNTPKR